MLLDTAGRDIIKALLSLASNFSVATLILAPSFSEDFQVGRQVEIPVSTLCVTLSVLPLQGKSQTNML